jgi:hypothetical protein
VPPRRSSAAALRIDAALLLAFLCLAWARYLFGGWILYTDDTFYYFYPYRYTLFSALQHGYFPDWESAALSGNPFCASPQANCYYPLSLWYLLPDFFTAYQWAMVSHLALAAIGTRLWLRQRGHSRPAALIAALFFVSSAPTLSLVNRLDKLETLCWWPWAMWGLERLMHRRRGGFAILSLALALQLLAGGLEVWGLAVASLFAWALLAGRAARNGAGTSDPPVASGAGADPLAGRAAAGSAGTSDPSRGSAAPSRAHGRLRSAIEVAAALLTSLLVTAPQWLALRELLTWSSRAGGVRYEKAVALSLEPRDLWGLLEPHLFHNPNTGGFEAWPGGPVEARFFLGLYLGWIPALAALLALRSALRRGRTGRTARVCLLLIASSVFMALGSHNPLYRVMFEHIGPLRSIRYPEKFLSLGAFFLLPMVAIGIDRLRHRGFRTPFFLGAAAMVALLGVPGPVARVGAVLLHLSAGGPLEAWAARLSELRPEMMRQALLLTSAGLAGLLAARGLLRRWAVSPLLFVLVGIDLWSGTWSLNPPLEGRVLRTPPALAATLRSVDPQARVHVLPLYRTTPLPTPPGLSSAQAYERLWQLFYPNSGVLSGFQYADGARALRLDHPTRFFAAFRGLPVTRQLELAALAGIDAVVADDADRPELERLSTVRPVGRDVSGISIWRLTAAAPRAYVVSSAVWFEDPDAALDAVLAGGYSPRSAVGLVRKSPGESSGRSAVGLVKRSPGESSGAADSRGDGAIPGGAASGTRAGPARVRVFEGGKRRRLDAVDAGEGGYLVLTEAWYPGWTARVDGVPAEVLEANGYQQAVKLTPGGHRIDLEYAPRGRGAALLLAALGLALVGASIWRPWTRRPHELR